MIESEVESKSHVQSDDLIVLKTSKTQPLDDALLLTFWTASNEGLLSIVDDVIAGCVVAVLKSEVEPINSSGELELRSLSCESLAVPLSSE